MAKSKLIKGDLVKIIAGSHKGEQGPITWISKDKKRVSIQGIEIVKHVKPSNDDIEGGIKQIPAKMDASNVAIFDPKSKNKTTTTRVGFEVKDGKKVRIARKSKHQLK